MNALTNRAVTVINLGRMGFMAAHDVQMRFARRHLDEMADKPYTYGEDTLLLVEHPPVYTVGLRTKDYTAEDEAYLKSTGAEFYKTNRGGLITFHGPGQLVAYPILNLQHFKPSVKWYVCQLEQTMIKTLQEFGLKGRTTDQTGVWVGNKKIGAIGLHASRYVTTHGISLNCNVDLHWFRHIVPCGLPGVEMTSLTKELGKDVSFQDSVQPFLKAFEETFKCGIELKMLEEDELKSISSPFISNIDAGATNKSHVRQADIGQRRNMSTTSSMPVNRVSTGKQNYILEERPIPMW
ncbi:lipoyltransferase 2 mitochondrial [Biomphalaria glabrata]|nr:putative lipoyltransferase 2; mitochondrial [Biomphalaria glabrata]